MQQILLRRGVLSNAQSLDDLARMAESEDPGFWPAITSGEVWGGSGSLFDLVLYGNFPGPEEELMADDQALLMSWAELADVIQAAGIDHERSRLIAASIRSRGKEA